MLDAFALGFMQRALLAGVLTALVAGYLGVFVVQRKMSFIGSGLAHAAFGGVALGLLLKQEPLFVAVPFTIVVAVLITWVRSRTSLSADTVIGIFFATSMALGILFISRLQTYAADAFTYLFGSILCVSWVDTAAVGALALIMLTMLPLWGRWAYATVDREAARADRIPVRLDDYILSVLVAVTVVVAAKVVGIVLISAFLVISPAAARLLSHRFLRMTVLSVTLGTLSAAAGLYASYALDIPSGAAIILVQASVFIVCAGYYIVWRRAPSI